MGIRKRQSLLCQPGPRDLEFSILLNLRGGRPLEVEVGSSYKLGR